MTILFIILTVFFSLLSTYLAYPWIRQKYSFRKYKEEYRSSESLMEHVYTSRNGTRIYTFKNLLNLPPKRAIRAEIAIRMSELCLTPKMFDEYTRAIKAAVNKNDLQQVGYLVGRMEERRTLPAEENTLKSLSDALFLLEGENPKATSDFWYKKKQALWAEDEDCYAFFLHGAMKTIRDIEELSPQDILNSLTRQAVELSLNRL